MPRSGFIALSVMAINTVAFVREMLKTLRTLGGESELDENIGTLALFKMLWVESNSKQLIFFCGSQYCCSIYGVSLRHQICLEFL